MRDKMINWALFLALCMIWGSSFILMKVGLSTLSAYQVASVRILSAGLILIPFAAKGFREIPRKKIAIVILSGLLGSFIPAYLFCIAETKIDSSLAGILNSLTPLFTVLIGISFFQLKAKPSQIIGVLVGFLGLCLLMANTGKVRFENLSYSALVMIAAFLYGVNVSIVGRHMQGIASISIASVAFIFLIIPCSIILFSTGYFSLPLTEKPFVISTAAACVLGIMGTAVASVIFYMLVKRGGTLFASMVTYGIPFVAVLWGVLGGEHITPVQVGCLSVILIGVWLVNKKARVRSRKLE